MDDPFCIGEPVLIEGQRTRTIVRLEGEMVRLSRNRGAIKVSSIVGKRPGGTIEIGGNEFLLLRPDPMDFIETLTRGAQIIVSKDSAQVVHGLALSPGCKIIEGGVGSGCLTLSLLNAAAPDGKVISYDVRGDHLRDAGSNISRSPFYKLWDGRQGDISEAEGEEDVDAFVVDVPEPERSVDAAARVLRPGGRFCSYVPTMNQMERVYLALKEANFSSIRAVEVIMREMSVKKGATRPVNEMLAHTGYLVFARWIGSPHP